MPYETERRWIAQLRAMDGVGAIIDEIQDVITDSVEGLHTSDKDIALGFSGGKDSATLLLLAVVAALELKIAGRPRGAERTIHFLHSDTLMELEPVAGYARFALDALEKFSKRYGLGFKKLIAVPKVKDRMHVTLGGYGLRPPSQSMRWCTSRLKINVQKELLTNAFDLADVGELRTISFVGTRHEESADRSKRLTKNALEGHRKIKAHDKFSKSFVFAPIEDLSTEEVWHILRKSDMGREVFDTERLWRIYAPTMGEGSECSTVLNGGDKGEKPGCSASSGRFACWSCPLIPKGKDKALQAMLPEYSYLRHLIAFRDWVVTLRDGNWHRYRDYYNHGDGRRLQYNLDKDGYFGSTSPGGLNLDTRREYLRFLLETEQEVRKEAPHITLIEDEELDFIQNLWIKEGDLGLSLVRIAKTFGRDVRVTKEQRSLAATAALLYAAIGPAKGRLAFWFNIHPDRRFCAQYVLQIRKRHGNARERITSILGALGKGDPHPLLEQLKKLQVRTQFFPSDELKALILREWKRGELSACTQQLVHDYEGTGSDHVQTPYDPTEDSSLSLGEQYAILDNWDTYDESDANERFEHPEYMRNGNYFQRIGFRPRLSDEYLKEKARHKALRTKPAKVGRQLALF